MQPRDSSIRTVVPYMVSLFEEVMAPLGEAALLEDICQTG